jgi:RimJ/RimL family protein N-acetyltransferase
MTTVEIEPCGPVALRLARSRDCEDIWRWNFAPDVRARSRRVEEVAFLDHAQWFAQRLAMAEDAPIWIIEEYDRGVGVVRIEPLEQGLPERGRALISIALDASVRGRGIGRAAVAAVCQTWQRPLAAEIFADNAASRTCFESCGFRPLAACDGLVTYHWDPEL